MSDLNYPLIGVFNNLDVGRLSDKFLITFGTELAGDLHRTSVKENFYTWHHGASLKRDSAL